MRCTATTKSGETCRNFALHGEDKCITHSQSKRARAARSKRRLISKEAMILELQRQLRKVKKSEEDSLEVSREIRMLLSQIAELQGITASERGGGEGQEQVREKRLPFEEAVREAQRKIDDEERGEEIR